MTNSTPIIQDAMADKLDQIAEGKRVLRASGYLYYDGPDEPIELNMNDTWGWAVAWGEFVPDEKILEVVSLFSRYGYCGLLYWVSEQNEQMQSEFEDVNRFVDFVRKEEELRKAEPDSSKRAYKKVSYTLGALDEAIKASGERAIVQDKKFQRAWLNLDQLPGGMMMCNAKEFGPVPATTTCLVTTSETEAGFWAERGKPVLEIWLAVVLAAQPDGRTE